MKATKNKRFILILFCIILLVFSLLFSYKTVLFFSDLTTAQENVFAFLEGKQELASEFTEREASHLEDVKKVMKYADHFFYLLLLMTTGIITYYRKDKEFLLKSCNYGGKATIAATVLFGVLAILFFDTVFTVFHEIFFPQGNWTFSAESLLIQTFPLDFFVTISRNIFLVTFFLGILFILSKHFYRHVRSNRH